MIYFVIGFLICGISRVISDFGGPVHNRPMWTYKPTPKQTFLVALLWFTRPVLDAWPVSENGSKVRALVFGSFASVVQLLLMSGMIWACAAGAALVTDLSILRMLVMVVLLAITTLFILPILQIPLMLVVTTLLIPLSWLFPEEEEKKEVKTESKQSKSILTYEQIKSENDKVRAIGKVLSQEVLLRAEKLANALHSETSLVKKGLVVSLQGSAEKGKVFDESLGWLIREQSIGLMLGLIAMRRSKGTYLFYTTNLEYTHMESLVSEEMVRFARRTMEFDGDLLPKYLENQKKLHAQDLEAIRKTIAAYCNAYKAGENQPEKSILDWFKSKTGFDASDESETSKMLRYAVEHALKG